jgi:hypothetical protein
MAALSELVRGAVTSARREGATLGAGEARAALHDATENAARNTREMQRAAAKVGRCRLTVSKARDESAYGFSA